MAVKGGVAFPGVIEAFIKLVIGVILAAIFLAVGWLAFEAIAKDLVHSLATPEAGTGLGILAGAVVVGVSIVVGATMLSLKK
ncbi:MAG: hypothetical protein QMD95_02265 [Candidatus Hodarchaeaceae archaeon]|nr:hypothetical protein [Candidatus Hodarchaeaceae archaeon]